MTSVTFYRISAGTGGTLRWTVVANYPIPDATSNASAVEAAERRFTTERRLDRWDQEADVALLRIH